MSIIALLMALPGLISFPEMVKQELSKVEEFTIDIKFNTTEPLGFPTKDPALSIANDANATKGKFIITNKELIYQPIFGVKKNFPVDVYKNVKENPEAAAKLTGLLFLFLLPSILVYFYVYNLVKYLIIVLIYSLLTKIIVSIMKKKIKYKKLLSAGFYSLTPLILVEMVLLPFSLPLFYIPFILYTIWYIIVSIELIEEF